MDWAGSGQVVIDVQNGRGLFYKVIEELVDERWHLIFLTQQNSQEPRSLMIAERGHGAG